MSEPFEKTVIVVESATSPSDVDVIGVFESFAVACEQVGIPEDAKKPDDLTEVGETWHYSVNLTRYGGVTYVFQVFALNVSSERAPEPQGGAARIGTFGPNFGKVI